MKKRMAFLCVLLCLALGGCGDAPETPEVPGAQASMESEQSAPQGTPNPTERPTDNRVLPTVQVLEVVPLLIADDVSGNSLYVAISFQNTCTQPIVISKADVVFSFDEKVKSSFVPMVYKDDVIQPQQIAQYGLWIPYEKAITQPITATCALTPELAGGQPPKQLLVADVFLTQNYPDFATISGTLTNDSQYDYSLSIVYLSFYDEADKLLGTWHFTKNLSINRSESKNFVMHMQTLRIADLASKTKRIQARAIGIT